MDLEFLSRLQFAVTIAFHYIFPPLSIGLGTYLVINEAVYLKTRDEFYRQATKYWVRIFALIFAIGVATGIVMEFEFGTNWATYSRFVGDVFGSALAAEGIFAFFLESGFLAVLLFGWDKVGPKMHFFSTLMVCLGSHFSAIWIVVANSWMQTPAGFVLEVNGQRLNPEASLRPEDVEHTRAVIYDFWAMVFNPSSVERLTHVILGSWLAGAFLVLSISAFYLLRGKHIRFARFSFATGLVLATVSSLLQLVSGHSSAEVVAEHQPVKLAAMEGQYETVDSASLSIVGWVDEDNQQTYSVAIPGMLSWLISGETQHEVKGLKDLPGDDFIAERHPEAAPEDYPQLREEHYWPKVHYVFQFYHLMVAIGMALIALSLWGCWLWWRGTLFDLSRKGTRIFLGVTVVSVLGPQIANQVGWFTAEMGRQPWIVYELMRTSEGLSKVVVPEQVLGSLLMFGFIYALLFALFVFLLTLKITHGPDIEEDETEYAHTKQLFKQ
ncbi:MAG: cytochrome d ubiquinol oxidase subunit I [Puniceicoccaceae bacterium 5H]|nr:MAG: cytochrome d ubiquinol oxidase subunit I [Puniceicoccaceae bacterium 5H]